MQTCPYKWASTRENLSSGVCEQHRCRSRAFSPYHQGPILGPIPNVKYPPFSPIFKKNQSLKLKINPIGFDR